jgi:hypothetical protein
LTPILGAAGGRAACIDAIERIDSLGRRWASWRALRRKADGSRNGRGFQDAGRGMGPKGNRYEDFEPGRVFKEPWGRAPSPESAKARSHLLDA